MTLITSGSTASFGRLLRAGMTVCVSTTRKPTPAAAAAAAAAAKL